MRKLTGIAIEPARGGVDYGQISNDLNEKSLNLNISNYMNKRFTELDIPTYQIRTTDDTMTRGDRVNNIKDMPGDNEGILIIVNSLSDQKNTEEGARIIYSINDDDSLAKIIANELNNAGQKTSYQTLTQPNDPNQDLYFFHRSFKYATPIIIQYGNLENENDFQKLNDNLYDYGEAVVKGISNYYRLPYKETNENTYIVKKGDYLYSIANEYKTTVEELKKLNNLSNDFLQVGDILKIPSETTNNNDNILYIVKAGDNLYEISKEYNTSVDELMKYNNLTTTSLSIGEEILIPKKTINEEKEMRYIVKPGDTLYNLAKRFKTTVDNLMNHNNMNNTMLKISQTIFIPKNHNYFTYSVKENETLEDIANEFDTDVDELKKINNLLTEEIIQGQILTIPK